MYNLDLATWQLGKKLIYVEEKFCLRFKLYKNFSDNPQKQSMDALIVTKQKSCANDSFRFQSLYSGKVTGTIIMLHVPSFTKKVV